MSYRRAESYISCGCLYIERREAASSSSRPWCVALRQNEHWQTSQQQQQRQQQSTFETIKRAERMTDRYFAETFCHFFLAWLPPLCVEHPDGVRRIEIFFNEIRTTHFFWWWLVVVVVVGAIDFFLAVGIWWNSDIYYRCKSTFADIQFLQFYLNIWLYSIYLVLFNLINFFFYPIILI